ncbi:hypothetical protein DPMN_091911 [Dreissena polymorpha]|uniref:Uncharacterized protein n=1 Tax=Dreissena polymorpha TaxID=45954 RepID=A0A9D4R0D6_DREPO|nr:hypothetical protein DPMN_091911 [Dreissena polymorpha]
MYVVEDINSTNLLVYLSNSVTREEFQTVVGDIRSLQKRIRKLEADRNEAEKSETSRELIEPYDSRVFCC